MLILREPVRAEVRRILLARLMSGELKPESRINESNLAAELGVSRTPLREALLNLEFEGFIESEQGKGFFVAPMTAKTAHNLHSLVGLLEGTAVKSLSSLGDDELAALLDQLDTINQELSREARKDETQNQERLIELGDEWHSLLLGRCDNDQLLEVLALLKARLYRYTVHFVGDVHRVEGTLDHHEAILDALGRRDFTAAADLLQDHWMAGADSRYDWLHEPQEGSTAQGPIRTRPVGGDGRAPPV